MARVKIDEILWALTRRGTMLVRVDGSQKQKSKGRSVRRV
jgi:hypothetical protein